jgi:hypothetical protein
MIFHFQIANFLLLLTTIHAQTTSTPRQLQSPTAGVKSKRGLFGYEDAIIGPPPPLPYQTVQTVPYANPTPRTVHTPSKFTNVFAFDDITYGHIFNELNGINYGIPTHITPPPTAAPSIYTNGYGYVNYGAPHDFETSYISHDGRIVKQYSVHERHHNDHPDPRNFRPSVNVNPVRAFPAQYPIPYFPTRDINLAQPRALFPNPPNTQNPTQIPTFLNKNHGPVALGSGGLGFVQLPNGDVFLGSGSLGYVSHKDHYDSVNAIAGRRQKFHPRGPLTFGHS